MELCATDLQRFLVSRGGRLPEFQIRTVLARILSGLAYLHARGIAHRDLKPQNVLLRHPDRFDDLCLTDFDCARRVPRGDPSQSGFHTLVGTPFFLAPEMVHRPDGGYGVKVDIYAVGVIGYMLLCGVTPFESAGTMVELYDRIVQRSWSWPEGLGSADFRRFVERLMAAGPAERPSAEEALGDAWMARPGLPRMLSGANVVFDSETGELKWIPVG
ncbi:kinase-like domain-containing protein [Hyaloraphidium curvatum]|nr:kinase-like domain-containing protein [Hyaloraphidium curvatum]